MFYNYDHTPCSSNLLVSLALSLFLSKILEKVMNVMLDNEYHCVASVTCSDIHKLLTCIASAIMCVSNSVFTTVLLSKN